MKKRNEVVDLTRLLKKYSSGWVALSENYKKVLAHAKTFSEIADKVEEQGDKEVTLFAVSKNYEGLIT